MMKVFFTLLAAILVSYASQAQSYASLADRAQDKLHNSFRNSGGTYYIENSGTSNTYFHYWWNAHALDVLVDAYIRTNDSKYVARINTLVNNWSTNNGGSIYKDYYDDMEWLALSLFRAYEETGNNTFLNMSTDIWDDIKTGQNSNQGGGIAWRKSQLDYKNTPANAPAIIYACRRHQMWGHSWELSLATDLYNWLKSTLRESSGRINDGINRQGSSQIDYWQFTYNYGVFIGAALEMYQSTNNAAYLNDAIATADYAIATTDIMDNGIFRNEGGGDGALFKGILARYLALLAQEPAVPLTKRNTYQTVLQAQAEAIYTNGFNWTHNLIGESWTQAPGSTTWMSAQLSGIMMLEVAAELGFTAPTPPAVLYQDCNGGGYSVSLGVGSYAMADLQALGVTNDDISSVDVASGYSLTMYRDYNFTGGSITKTSNDACLVDDGFNDDISSVVVSQSGARISGPVVVQENREMMVYPNPVTIGDQLQFDFDGSSDVYEIQLLDLMGREVFSHAVVDSKYKMSTVGVKAGTYIVRIRGGSVFTSKVLIK
ncbi:glycoside hydrolase family 76 protein [Marinoscillum pacificum]|uniref:glycoside hydrolase family 76 protein n=1 Tax=Marinoscillum pacificum TaxID=392723 RepID=UPI002157F071|nr:glycoside hydrolase family 76 protein [Marinoscillum pacificum]